MCRADACSWLRNISAVGVGCLVLITVTAGIGVFSQPGWPGAIGCLLVAAAGIAVAVLPYVRTWRRHATLSDGRLDDHMVRMFTGGLLPMALCALTAEVVLTAIGGIAILGLRPKDAEVLSQAEQAREQGKPFTPPDGTSPTALDVLEGNLTPRVALFMLFLAFCVAACVEEVLKWAMLRVSLCCGCEQHSCCLQPRPRSARATVALMLAVAAGFSTIENLLYVGGVAGGWESKLLTAAGRCVLSMPLHIIAASFTAVRLASVEVQNGEAAAIVAAATPAGGTPAAAGTGREHFADDARAPDGGADPAQPGRPCRTPCALVPAVLIHGTFDLVLLLAPTLLADRVAGTIPVGAAVGGIICGIIVILVSAIALRYELQAVIGREDALAASADGGGHGAAAPVIVELPTLRGPQARPRADGPAPAAAEDGVFGRDADPLLTAEPDDIQADV